MLKEEFLNFIKLKQEGSFWDFKERWYTNKYDMLHDIICMANNKEDRDGYLIIGVKDITMELMDISNDPNRRDTQSIVDFLKNKPFVGGIRPILYVETIEVEDKQIDIIVVKNTNYTPYYLSRDYGPIKANYIYTRVQDTNTPKDMNADINDVEYLWKKRFGINRTIMDRLSAILNNWEDWGVYSRDTSYIQGGDFGNFDYIMNIKNPEFRIEIDRKKYIEWTHETMRCFYINQTAGMYNANIFFNNTILYNFNLAHVDEYRKFLVVPRMSSFINEKHKLEKGVRADLSNRVKFYYILMDSIVGKVQKIITNGTLDTSSYRSCSDKYWLLYFDNEEELDSFKMFSEMNQDYYIVNLKNNEYSIGDEKNGAHVAMTDIHNAYRYYVKFLIEKKGRRKEDFEDYYSYFDVFIDNK